MGGDAGRSIRRNRRTGRKEIEESIAKKRKVVPHNYSKHYKYSNQTEVMRDKRKNLGQRKQIHCKSQQMRKQAEAKENEGGI